MTPLEAAWEGVISSPGDDHALHVLSDALMERGDPHGELIRLQLAGDEAGAQDHLATHATELLGDALRLASWKPVFARGFITAIKVGMASELEAILARPVGRVIKELRVSALMTDPIEQMIDVLSSRGPSSLSTLHIGSGGLSPGHPGELEVSKVTSRFTSLETLSLGSWPLRFEGAQSASLRSLSVNLQDPTRGLGEARFSVLEELALDLPFRRLDLPLSLLAGDVAPRLSSLRVYGALWPQQLGDLAVSALLRGLKRLEISAEADTGWYRTLLETIDSFAHLESLELVADRHHPEWVQAVKTALPQARIREPQLRL